MAQGLRINLDLQDINKIKQDFNNLITDLQNKANKAIDLKINSTSFQDQLKKQVVSIEDAVKAYEKLGKVKVGDKNFDENGNLKSFILSLERVEGIVDKIKFKAKDLVGGAGNSTQALNFNVTGINQLDNVDKVIEKMNSSQSKLEQNIIKSNEKIKASQEQNLNEVIKFVDTYNEKINNLYANSKGIPLQNISGLESQVNNLQGTESAEQLMVIEKEYQRLIELETQYANQIKADNQAIKESFSEQGRLINYLATQKERLNNVQSTYGKIDKDSSMYSTLDAQYKAIIGDLEKYKLENKELSIEEKQEVNERINNLKRLSSEYNNINSFIRQQEASIQGLQGKFSNVIKPDDFVGLRTMFSNLPNSNNIVADMDKVIEKSKQLKTELSERQRVSNLGVSLGAGLNLESSIQEVQKFARENMNAKASVTSLGQVVEENGKRYRVANVEWKSGTNQIERQRLTIDESLGAFKSASTSVQDLSNRHMGLANMLKHNMEQFINFTVVMGGFYAVINQVRDALKFEVNLDTKLSNISMITGEAKDNLQQYATEWNDLAIKTKSSTNEILEGMENFLRAGIGMSEANKLIETNIKLSRVSGDNAKETSDNLIKLANSYKLNADGIEQFANKVAYLDSNTAAGTKGMTTSLVYTAQTAVEAGVSLDYLLGMISTIQEKSKVGFEGVGRSVKSMLLNMQKIKTDDDTEPLNKLEKALNKQGIALRSSEKEWRNSEDVIKDIQKAWGGLDSVTKSTISQYMAGKEQAETFKIIMSDSARVMENYNGALGATNNLNEKYTKHLQSTQGSLNELKATTEKFYMTLINGSAINGFVNGLTNIVKFLGLITTESKGSGLALLGLGISMITVIKYSSSLISVFSKLRYEFQFFMLMAEMSNITTALSTSFGVLGKSVMAFFTTLLSNPIVWVVAGLGALAISVINQIKHQKALQEQTDSLATSYKNLNTAINDNNLISMKNESDNIKKQVDIVSKLVAERDKLQKSGFIGTKGADSKIAELNKQIEEQKKVLKDAGIEFDNVSGKAYELALAEGLINLNESTESIKRESKAKVENDQSTINLINRYNELANVENKTKAQKLELSTLSEQLASTNKELVISTDEYGNATIKNNELLGKQKEALEVDIQTVNADTQARINNAINGMKFEYDNTSFTIQEVEKRINAYMSEIDSLEMLNQARMGNVDLTYVDTKTQRMLSFYANAKSSIDKIRNSMSGTQAPSISTPSYIPTKSGGSSKSTPSEDSISEALLEKERYAKLNQELAQTSTLLGYNKSLQEQIKSESLTSKEIEQLQKKKIELIAINAENQKIIDSTKNAKMNPVTGQETSFGNGSYTDENGNLKTVNGVYKGKWTDQVEESGGIKRQLMAMNNGDKMGFDVSNTNLTAWQDSDTFKDEVSYYKKAYEKGKGQKGWQKFYDEFDPNGYTDSGYSDKTYELMSNLGFDPDKIKKYFQENPIDIQWKQESFSNEDIANMSKEIIDNNKELLDINTKLDIGQINKIKLMNDEINLLKQKQENYKAIADEQRKERSELISSLSKKGVTFNGEGDFTSATNADEILNKKMDEVNATRADKNKTVHNQLKYQYQDLQKEVKRFIEIQTNDLPKSLNEWNSQATEIAKVKKEMKSLAETSMKAYLELEQNGKKEDLTKAVYGVSESEWKAWKQQKISSLKKDIQDLKSVANSQSEIEAKQIELKDLQKQSYSDKPEDLKDQYLQIHQNKIDNIQKEIDAIDKQNEAQQEQADLLEKQNNLIKLQSELTNIQSDKSVKILQKQADGTSKFVWDYDHNKARDKQAEVDKAQLDLSKTQKDLADKHRKEDLEKEKKYQQDLISAKETSFTKENTAIENHYKDIDTLTKTSLDELNKTYGGKWDVILKTIQEKINTATGLYKKLATTQNSTLNSEITQTTTITTETESTSESGTDSSSSSNTDVAHADNGGMTPSWGSGGKQMVVHQDELILNPVETKDILQVSKVSSSLIESLKSINLIDVLSKASNLMPNFKIPNYSNLTPALNTSSGTVTKQYSFNGDIILPNVSDPQSFVDEWENYVNTM